MKAEIITIGDELISGIRVDTNSAFLAQQLAAIGIAVEYKTAVGDRLERMEEAFQVAMRRADIVITTGGLGPTDDDITKKAIVKVFKRNLIFHEEILEDIQRRYADRGIEMPAINQNQALLPQGGKFLSNRIGSAVGIVIDERGTFFCSLPGVPTEMKTITEEELIPLLREKVKDRVIVRHVFRNVGLIESALAELIQPTLINMEGIDISYLPSTRGIDVIVRGTGTFRQEVEENVSRLADKIRELAGTFVYTEDNRGLEQVIGDRLVESGKTLAVAESCTAGLLGGRVTEVPGSSRYFRGGIIAYDNGIKTNLLQVPEATLRDHGAVSAETAQAMAVGVRAALSSDYGLSITGIAGPDGGSPEKPVGTVFVGLATARKSLAAGYHLGVDRANIRERSVTAALDFLRYELFGLKRPKM